MSSCGVVLWPETDIVSIKVYYPVAVLAVAWQTKDGAHQVAIEHRLDDNVAHFHARTSGFPRAASPRVPKAVRYTLLYCNIYSFASAGRAGRPHMANAPQSTRILDRDLPQALYPLCLMTNEVQDKSSYMKYNKPSTRCHNNF